MVYIQYIKNCWVKLLSNYNIKYICTIYIRLNTCLMAISRLFLRDKVTLRLLKLWFRALDIRLSDWCSAVYQWCEFKSRRRKNTNLSAQRSNSYTVGFKFQMYIYHIIMMYIWWYIYNVRQHYINSVYLTLIYILHSFLHHP